MAGHFENMTFLFAGKLKSMKREEAVAKVEALGGKCVSGVSKSLSVLVATSETGAKWTKAQELNSKGANIQFWTEEQFMAELEKAEKNSKVKAGGKKPHPNTSADAAKATKTASKPKLTAKQLEKLNKDLLKAVDNSKPSIEKIKSLIDAGADVNAKYNKGRTPLHYCEDADIAKILIDAGANVNAKDKGGNTPLNFTDISADIAKMLIEAGADVNAKNDYGRTPLHNCKDGAKAHLLLDAGADVNAKDKGGNTPLHLCQRADVAKPFIDAGADVNAKDNDGKTPLHNCEDADAVKVLIDAGADVNAKDNKGRTPLHHRHDADAVKVLIDAGADVNAKDNDGRTPLHRCEDADVVKVLIDAGADVNAKDNDGKTPSFYKKFTVTLYSDKMYEALESCGGVNLNEMTEEKIRQYVTDHHDEIMNDWCNMDCIDFAALYANAEEETGIVADDDGNESDFNDWFNGCHQHYRPGNYYKNHEGTICKAIEDENGEVELQKTSDYHIKPGVKLYRISKVLSDTVLLCRVWLPINEEIDPDKVTIEPEVFPRLLDNGTLQSISHVWYKDIECEFGMDGQVLQGLGIVVVSIAEDGSEKIIYNDVDESND